MAFQKYSHMDQSLFTRFVRLGIPYIELNAQGKARPSITQLYNRRYRDLGDLPSVKEEAIFHRANAGFSYDYQLMYLTTIGERFQFFFYDMQPPQEVGVLGSGNYHNVQLSIPVASFINSKHPLPQIFTFFLILHGRSMYQYMAYSEQLTGTSEEENSEHNPISSNQAMEVDDTAVAENCGTDNNVHENNGQEAKEDADVLQMVKMGCYHQKTIQNSKYRKRHPSSCR
ncbi:hypothetical protein F3Y22_tig00110893pilonHSYRG01277 [Hibiscus syriacus]|uniref:Uncharacterized protein n=1 Tax=Hibiscus syriacus TaxID=106335 RepID=A0A6A2ZHE0_HIBSY|nr:hypothetical protein F3Y22_tig00110893pilonHSYRG01277 [Hibiscus syriacus]